MKIGQELATSRTWERLTPWITKEVTGSSPGIPTHIINIQMENLQRSLEAARRSQDPKKL